MAEAGRLRSSTGLRPLTYTTLIGLLASTGLRPGEALALDKSDVDLENGILSIRQTKFGKSRFVPLDSSTRAALQRYAEQRDALCHRPRSSAFLITERGIRVQGSAARRTFAAISCAIGLRPPRVGRHLGRGPRLQDFRHSFTTQRLVEWYRAGTRCRTRVAETFHISRPCRNRAYLLVYRGRSRIAGACDQTSWHRARTWR